MFTRKKTLWRVLAALLALSLVAAACGDDDDEETTDEPTSTTESRPETGTTDGVLKIGYLLPQTGALDFLGPPMIQAVKMAVKEINEAGGVLGKPVELVEADDGTDPDVASQALDNLLAEKVDYIVGAAASGVTLAVIDRITGSGFPECSPSNTGVQFTDYDDNDLYFRTAPPDNLQAQVLADLIVGDGHEEVVVLGRSDEYGEGFARFLEQELESLGATVPERIIYDHEAGSYQAEAQQIADAEPDAVAMISFDEGAQVLTAAIAAGVGPDKVQWYGADGIQSSTFWQKVDANNAAVVQGIRGTAPSAAPADGEPTWKPRFQVFAPGTDTIFSGHAYDCTILAALAAAQAETDDPAEIGAAIVDLTRDGERCVLIAECFQLIEDGENIDYDGAAGPLDFIDAGEPSAGAYDTWEFDAQGKVVVEEESIKVTAEDE